MRFQLTSAAHLFLFKDDQILLIRRQNTGWQDGNYSVVAGHLDGGETVTAAMSREAKEEAGLLIPENELSVVHVSHRIDEGRERVDFFCIASAWPGEPVNCEPDKCDGMEWFPLNKLPQNTIPYIRNAIEQTRAGNFFSSFGW